MDMLHGPLAGKIVSFALPIAAATTFTSQNFAAGKTGRCRRVGLLP